LFVNGTKEEAAIALKTAKLLAGKNVKKAQIIGEISVFR